MRILTEPLTDVFDERLERIVLGGLAHAGDPLTGQIGADGLAVPTQMPGDRGDRPTPPVQRVRVDVFLPCQHGKRGLLR
ncbi:hypothetical protein [Nocardioides immobilis]|uniref:hypothetical protein n=1 Tax=Nocardioides immobilis TaxID=2049295 RepID=UPI001C7174FD|nr:hypothetical protein [Nocardioides immobilis]